LIINKIFVYIRNLPRSRWRGFGCATPFGAEESHADSAP